MSNKEENIARLRELLAREKKLIGEFPKIRCMYSRAAVAAVIITVVGILAVVFLG